MEDWEEEEEVLGQGQEEAEGAASSEPNDSTGAGAKDGLALDCGHCVDDLGR